MTFDLERIKNKINWPDTVKIRKGQVWPHTFFDEYKLLSPEHIVRDNGDSTLFTTAAIQRLETLHNQNLPLPTENIMVYQPCVRMQYIDTVKQGSGTSFINFSVTHFNAVEDDFLRLTSQLQRFMLQAGANPADIETRTKSETTQWGDRHFAQSTLAFYVDNHQFSEVIFMHDYPHFDSKTNIIEVGLGIERAKYLLEPQKPYYREFSDLYTGTNFDDMTNVIDCIKTFMLISGEGVVPGYKSHKYRLRQLSKKLVSLPLFKTINAKYIAKISYQYWLDAGIKFSKSFEETYAVLQKENERNLHSLEIAETEQRENFKINLDINLPESEFRKRLNKLIYDNNLQRVRK